MDGPQFIPKSPLPVGVTSAPASISREKIEFHRLKVAGAATLRDLNKDYAFYTPALIYTHIRLFGREPFLDFIQDYGEQVVPVTIRFNKPIFAGLRVGNDESWNYVLYGIPREHWEPYLQWMGPMTFVDRGIDLLARVRFREFEIADPIFFERCTILPSVCPTVPITVFCLDTNKGRAWIEEGPHPLMDLPRYRWSAETHADTNAFAAAVLHEQENPYEAVETVEQQLAALRQRPPLEPAKAVAFTDLPADKQREILDGIRQYRDYARRRNT